MLINKREDEVKHREGPFHFVCCFVLVYFFKTNRSSNKTHAIACRTEADRGALVFISSTNVTHVIAVCAHGPDKLCKHDHVLLYLDGDIPSVT